MLIDKHTLIKQKRKRKKKYKEEGILSMKAE